MTAAAGGAPAREPATIRLVGYALPALPLAVMTLPLYVIVPNHYSAELGLSLAGVGAVLLLVRLFDALTDPLAGVLCDRVRLPGGRRRGWFAAAIPLTALAAYMVFTPPADATLVYLGAWSLLLSLGWTLGQITYAAWGAELSGSYHGRSRVASFREGFVLAGTMAAAATPAVVAALGGKPSAALLVIALFVAIGLPLLGGIAVATVPEPADLSRTRLDWRASRDHLLANRPFLRLVAAFVINGVANGLPATLFLYYVDRVLDADALQGAFLLAYFFCAALGIPLWLRLSLSWGKHRTWCLAMLMACAVFAAVPLLGPGDVVGFGIVCVLTGLGLGADLVMPASIQADVVEHDLHSSGEQRAGLYFALWGVATKLALALAVGAAFPILAAAGFAPDGGAAGLPALVMLYAVAPIALKLGAIALMWEFPAIGGGRGRPGS